MPGSISPTGVVHYVEKTAEDAILVRKRQEETWRDMERLCETTPHGGGAIFAPLKLLNKRGDRRSAEVMGEPLFLLLRAFYILCRVFRSVG